MDVTVTTILTKVDRLLEDDLILFSLAEHNKKEAAGAAETRRKRKQRFIEYLVSVGTHPIGLHPSVSPLNNDQEHMLAYIMEMFSISEARLRKILRVRQNRHSTSVNSVSVPVTPKKRHSWRPELRVRLNAPLFFYNKGPKLDKLYVRVYLFKHETVEEFSEGASVGKIDDADIKKGKGILNKIFRRFQLSQAVLIRPVSEMRYLLGFEQVPNAPSSHGQKSGYTMVIFEGETYKVDDIYLQMRRYYCNPDSRYILRFEFWFKVDTFRLNWFEGYRSWLKRLVYDGCRCKRKSTYMNESFTFYGYVNIKLSQLPSYAIKLNQSILSLRNRKVNNCEIILELRNRRIIEDDTNFKFNNATAKNVTSKKPKHEYLINHIRLYVNCILYQSAALSPTSCKKLLDNEASSNMSLYNLLYLPAYTLINQHRLQSNLSQLEDESLKRISIFLLLLKLQQKSIGEITDIKLVAIRLMLIYILKNEYMNAHRRFNEQTMQEVDPFGDDLLKGKPQTLANDIEFNVLKQFVDKFLYMRLKSWPLRQASEKSRNGLMERQITLLGLKLIKAALTYYRKSTPHNQNVFDIDISSLKKLVDQVLCRVVLNHLIEQISITINRSNEEYLSVYKRTNSSTPGADDESNWLRLLHEIKYINHDICLYWSRSGLDGILKNEQEYVKGLKVIKRFKEEDTKNFIKGKIDNYLR